MSKLKIPTTAIWIGPRTGQVRQVRLATWRRIMAVLNDLSRKRRYCSVCLCMWSSTTGGKHDSGCSLYALETHLAKQKEKRK